MAGGVELATAYIDLIVTGDKVAPGVRRALGSADGEAVRAGDRAGKSFTSRFGSSLKIGATLASAFAVTKGVQFLGDAIAEAKEASVVTARTSNVIKSMGIQSRITSGDVADLATSISNKVGQDDEAIQTGLNMLLTFKNLSTEVALQNGILKDASGLMVDYATVMETDTKSAAISLGKALNDPVKGMAALGRVGVQFSEDQQEAIKTMVESGDTLGAQKIILGELESQFKGAAKAMATPADRAKVAWGNLKEQIGNELLPTFNRVAGWFADEGVPAISDFFDEMRSGKGVGGDVADTLGNVRDAVKGAAGFAGDLVGYFENMPGWAQKVLLGGAVGGIALGKFRSSALGSATGLGGVQKVFVTNMPVGSTGTGGKGGLSAFWPAAAITTMFPGVLSETQAALKGAGDNIGASAKSIADSLNDSNVGKNAEEFGINVDKLAVDIARFGDEGKYFKEVMSNLTKDTGLDAFAEGFASGIIPGWHSGIEKADDATHDLLDTVEKVKQADNRKWFMGLIRSTDDFKGHAASLADTILGTGKSIDLVDGKRPDVPWAFPGLFDGLDNTGKLGKDTDQVGKKRPSVGWTFPGLLDGLTKVWGLDRAMDQLHDKTITITTFYRSDGTAVSSAGGQEAPDPLVKPRAMGGPVYAGKPYLVGERGPELVVPSANARVIPNGGSAGMVVDLSERSLRAIGERIESGSFRGTRAGSSDKAAALNAARRT